MSTKKGRTRWKLTLREKGETPDDCVVRTVVVILEPDAGLGELAIEDGPDDLVRAGLTRWSDMNTWEFSKPTEWYVAKAKRLRIR